MGIYLNKDFWGTIFGGFQALTTINGSNLCHNKIKCIGSVK